MLQGKHLPAHKATSYSTGAVLAAGLVLWTGQGYERKTRHQDCRVLAWAAGEMDLPFKVMRKTRREGYRGKE